MQRTKEARQNPSLLRKRILSRSSIFATRKNPQCISEDTPAVFFIAKIEYQLNLRFLATGRFCLASLNDFDTKGDVMGAFDFPAERAGGVLVYSGGMDSTTLLHECRNTIKLCLSFNYGAKHNARELEFARANCQELGIPHTVVELPFIEELFRSDLLKSGGVVPEGEYSKESLKSTVVPFRNGIMLSVAAGVAESRRLSFVMLANHASDREIYPDCRPHFIESMGQAIYLGSDCSVSVIAPYTHLTKREIALRGKELSVDFAKSWSCYKGLERHCGRCSTCHERKHALAGFDNTSYLE